MYTGSANCQGGFGFSPTRWWPRSIQWQMLAGLLLLESLSLALFAFLVTRQQAEEITARTHRRLAFEADSLAMQAGEALLEGRPGWIGLSVRMMGDGPTVSQARITDPPGNVLFVSSGEHIAPASFGLERAQIPLISHYTSQCFTFDDRAPNALTPSLRETICAALPGSKRPHLGIRATGFHPPRHHRSSASSGLPLPACWC